MADFRGQHAMVNQDTFAVMREEGRAQYPNEACGLIIKKGKKSLALPCRNISERPRDRFTLDPVDYAKCSQQGEVIAVWHTHTDRSADPSPADLASCETSGMPWYILSVGKSGEEFQLQGPIMIEPSGHETPYLERPYVFGIHDCYTLVVDFYAREFAIAMKRDYPRVEEFWKKGLNPFVDHFADEGFVELIDQEPKRGDVFLIQSSSNTPNHLAVYLGDDVILHHAHGRLSTRDIYGGFWQKHTVHHVRHEALC